MDGRVLAHGEPATGCGPAGLSSAPAHHQPGQEPGAGGGWGRGRKEELGWEGGGRRAREMVVSFY